MCGSTADHLCRGTSPRHSPQQTRAIVQQLSVVCGIVVRSRSIFGTIGGALQTLVGGKITLFTELREKTREEAFDIMVDHGQQIGANDIVGVRYDTTELMDSVTKVHCYGTAVVVEQV